MLTVIRSTTGRLQTVNVPYVIESDPQWYREAVAIAGISPHEAYSVNCAKLLTLGKQQQKLAKSDKNSRKYLSAVLHLAPHKMSGRNVCPKAGACAGVCVNFNGKGVLENTAFEGRGERWIIELVAKALRHHVHSARIARTRLYHLAPELFAEAFEVSMGLFIRKCAKAGRSPMIRPNGTSDIAWENFRPGRWGGFNMFEEFPAVSFYDYTKIYPRARAWAEKRLPKNYSVTFSRDETNDLQCARLLELGGKIAVVIRNSAMEKSWGGHLATLGKELIKSTIKNGLPEYSPRYKLVNGDATDLRHRDKRSTICLLYAKGRASRDDSGFALQVGS